MSRASIWLIVAVMSVALVGIATMQVTWIRNMIQLNVEQFDESVFSALNKVSERLALLENLDAYDNGYSIDYIERRFSTRNRTTSSSVTSLRSTSRNAITAVPGHAPDCTCAQCHDAHMRSNWQRYIRYNARALDAPLEKRIDHTLLDTILRQELRDHGIEDSAYTYGVFSRKRQNFIIRDGHYTVDDQGPVSLVSLQAPPGGSLATSRYGVALFDDITTSPPGLLMIHFPQQSSIVMGPVWLTIFVSGLLLSIILGCFAYSIFVIFRQKRLSLMKNDFISNMTHEFKTPIATISLAADSITNPKVMGSPDRLQRFAGIIKQENRRMNRQVEKVLQAAMIDRREFELKPVELNVHDLISEAADHMGLQVEPRGGSIQLDLSAKHPVLSADRLHLSNILHNLIDNANKYSPEAPHITVRTEDTRSGVRISVTDRGIGMTKEDQRQIFEKFFRVHTGNRHDVKGFGLGLSYVKAVTEAHGGRVAVSSTLGEGATFSVEFPRSLRTS